MSCPVKSILKDFYDADPVKVMPKTSSGPVKSIPKDFSDADPVEVIRPPLVLLNRCLKIFLMSIQSKIFKDLVWSS